MLDPILASREIEETYSRYLRSTLRPRDPALQQDLLDALTSSDHRLARGPILQAAAPYTKGASIRTLVERGVLSPKMLQFPENAFSIDRQLYTHQEAAISQIMSGGNALVATGTGSGKTESFLLPIIDHLLNEETAGTLSQPGVRAMLLYPMNALANDQLKRLRMLLAAFPNITFGRYTGETEEKYDRAVSTFRSLFGTEPAPNELIAREQINERPPHILVTNFAMLEYLLLRPKDSSLFDGPTGTHWKFIVLDEVHVYDGSKGAEIAYLLRRLRDRVVSSERGRLTYVGTSATLGSGAHDRPRLIDFAHSLFDETFTEKSLIEPRRISLNDLKSTWKITGTQIQRLLESLHLGLSPQALVADAADAGCPPVEPVADRESPALNLAATLGRLLMNEEQTVSLRRRLGEGAVDVASLRKDQTVGEADLVGLIELAWRAVDDDNLPVLPARYHTFLRSLEGAFICIDPEHPGKHRLRLNRQHACVDCLGAGRQRQVFEFGSCRRCGSRYVLGDSEITADGKQILVPAGLNERGLVHLLLDPKLDGGNEDDEIDEENGDQAGELLEQVLCAGCGAYGERGQVAGCCESALYVDATLVEPGKGGLTRRCGACGASSKGNVVYRYLSGADASGSVIASTLYQGLPADPEASEVAVAGGRKLLSFSDSRQDAAFFAPYLERTHQRSVERRVIWTALSRFYEANPDEPLRFESLVTRVRDVAQQYDLFDPSLNNVQRRDLARAWVFGEIIATDTALGLEGIGLARIAPAAPSAPVPAGMIPDGLDADDVRTLVQALLNTLRINQCVLVPDGVDMTDDRFTPRNFVTYVRSEVRDRVVVAWSPATAVGNSRSDIVEKVFATAGVKDDPRQWLRDCWGWLTVPGSPWTDVIPAENQPRIGAVRRLNPNLFEFVPAGKLADLRRCGTCGTVTWFDIRGVCTKFRCGGMTTSFVPDPENHYFRMYSDIEPVKAVVEEHTAQLESREAARRQAAFVNGAINILSCSTTFELGVDVGEIQSVFLRNVPPNPANYVQRAGRAGRRTGSPALVVTYAQRRNHDEHYFRNPSKMIDGIVQPPVIQVENAQIARRHVHSVALAAFLRVLVDGGHPEPKTVEDFFVANEVLASVADRWVEWLRSHPVSLQDALSRILPTSIAAALGIASWTWVDDLANEPHGDESGGWLFVAAQDVLGSLADLQAEIERLIADNKLQPAAGVQRVQAGIKSTQMLSQLARKIVIPKYGFPVDTVSLDLSRSMTSEASRLELDRDLALAIVEYSPGAQVVADKKLWQSEGVRIPKGLALQQFSWSICAECESLSSKSAIELEPEFECSVCGGHTRKDGGRFVWPEYGFVGKDAGGAGESRPVKTGFARPMFAEYAVAPDPEPVAIGSHLINLVTSRHGEVQLINKGPGAGFRFCTTCGRMEIPPTEKKTRKVAADWKHDRPGTSTRCGNTTFRTVALGHRYRTDVVELRLGSAGNLFDYQSALQAVVAALPEIGIQRSDVHGMLRRYDLNHPYALCLVDSVPGGAGHARRIADEVELLLAAAYLKASSCDCGEDTSCYGCLRSYDNQFVQDQLSRRGAMSVLYPYSEEGKA